MDKNATEKLAAPVSGTVFDYLRWRGDLTFQRDAFNEVDNLVLCIISYINFRRIDAVRTKAPAAAPTLEEICPLLTEQDDQLGLSELSYLPLVQLAARTARFQNVRLYGFTHEYDPEKAKQFDALSFLLPDGTLFVAYMGTDTSLAGWKEDFNMSFLSAVPAQERATAYAVEMAATCPERPLRIGGQQGRQPGSLGGAAHSGGPAGEPPAGRLQQRRPGLRPGHGGDGGVPPHRP